MSRHVVVEGRTVVRRGPMSALTGTLVGIALAASPAVAAPAESASASKSAATPKAKPRTRAERKATEKRENERERAKPWLYRWQPQRNLGELGLGIGILLPSEDHDLYDPATAPQKPLWKVGPDISVRAAFFPLEALGVEAEFSADPTRARTFNDDFAFVYGFRGHVILQLPVTRINPFLLGGYGLMGVRSNQLVLGKDIDPAFHYGAGVKMAVTRRFSVRAEARQIVSASTAKDNSGTFHVQVLAGFTLVLGRKFAPVTEPPPPVDPDRDKDGILNRDDRCPDTAGVRPTGCPDRDGDTFIDEEDKCPEVAGVAPDGCPVKDTDGDGIVDPEDDCPYERENFNGYEDDDGCPEKLPPKLVKFDGVIKGIEFDFRKDTIRPGSKPLLDEAVEAMQEFPGVKVTITGFTDNVGTEAFNLDLSKRRAAAVKKYLVDHGVASERITTDGKGSADPIGDNTTEEGRALNRRIEFEITENVAKEVPAEEPPADTSPP